MAESFDSILLLAVNRKLTLHVKFTCSLSEMFYTPYLDLRKLNKNNLGRL